MKSRNNTNTTTKNKVMIKNSTLMLLLAVIMVACGGGGSDKKAELEKLKKQKADLEVKIAALQEEVLKSDTTIKEKITDVVAIPVTIAPFKTYIEIQGRIDADENVFVSSEMPGTITKINVKVGDQVSKGTVLAETDARATQQQIADLNTNLELAKQVYDKTKSLWDQKIGTEIQYLQSKNNKESLENKIATMQEQVRMSKIISPINGTVDNISIKLGQSVAPGMQAISVINFSNLKVKAEIAESYAARVKTGNEVLVLFPDTKDTIASKINYASRGINALTRTFGVEVYLDTKGEYHPNMVTKLRINDYTSPKPEITVPVKFIQKGATESFVLVAEGGKAVKKIVKINHEYAGIAEVTEGLKEGDMIITEGYDLINDGDKIAVAAPAANEAKK
ncbi:efflux transporter periplasmic adaptor subunit [Sphingobacteriaceae bacterium]|nr:efflux transporter periplasmic adaptor subunit [Sphingobacteriaceae bacterium]